MRVLAALRRRPARRLLPARRFMLACRFLPALALAAACLALAAPPARASAVLDALSRLTRFGIVPAGAETRAGAFITRAEFATMVVTATGRQARAAALVGSAPFSDIAGHPAEGYIAAAAEVGYMTGRPGGRFDPDARITYAEVAAVLVRIAGLAPDDALPWPDNYVSVAAGAGIIPRGLVLGPYLGADAVRGAVFVLLDSAMLEVRGPEGLNLYQVHHDAEPPVITLDPQPAETAARVMNISGTVSGAAVVRVEGYRVTVGPDGRFEQLVPLRVGNNVLEVAAWDDVGNQAVAVIDVRRQAPEDWTPLPME